ncbi:MAG: two-component system response regulator PilR (NtrC family) [Oleiphilaceae bacterium]|jgi:two-component system response regulator PilR (NtrC family)
MNRPQALIIDDEPDIRELLEITLIRMGVDTVSAKSVDDAHLALSKQKFDICLTDMNLPDGNGIDLVSHIQEHYPNLPVAMITAYGSVETAISALKAGAFDFISKPVDLKQLRNLVTAALNVSEEKQSISEQNNSAKKILGQTQIIQTLNMQINKLARSQAPIYILGESGSGKELVARLIHEQSHRSKSGQFIAVNCGAIPTELVESEFFGHKKGSFSGAIDDKLGLFRAAEGGTLFLDEVADLPLAMQVKLLRAIQEKSIRPVGEQQEIKVDIRLLSATHKDLSKLVQQGQFREDLFYRINVIKLDVPSLRKRKADIPLLAQHFLNEVVSQNNGLKAEFDTDALQALQEYSFPGNVRELQNTIERAFTLCDGNIIRLEDLQFNSAGHTKPPQNSSTFQIISETPSNTTQQESNLEYVNTEHTLNNKPAFVAKDSPTQSTNIGARAPNQSLEEYLEVIERKEIEQALLETKWNRTAAAKRLGLSFRALRYKLKKLGLD